MKIYIGPYKNFWGVYQIVELLHYVGVPKDTCYDIATKIDDKFPKINKVLNDIHGRRERKVKIRIDAYDSWNADSTLAMIIVPLLKQLKETKHGSPGVDDEDVPEHLRSTAAAPKEHDWDVDDFWHLRWEWVMNQMIFAFEHTLRDWEYDDFAYDHTNPEFQKVHERIKNGRRLFAKYYDGLWD